MSAAEPLAAALAALEAARAAERAAADTVDYWDASETDAPTLRRASAVVLAEARAERIDAERAAEAILSALPDATARRAALYAAGVR